MEKINIAELLKDCPKGMELDCVIFDNVQFDTVQDGHAYPIKINTPEGRISLSKYGCYSLNQHCKCIIFPKGKTTWEGFQRPFKDGDIAISDRGGIHLLRTANSSYCAYREYWKSNKFDKTITTNINIVRLANETEKAKLFDAIKANGYKWNAETKTLEKLIEPKFKVGDRVRHKILNIIYTIKEVATTLYYTDKQSIFFDHEDNWEIVEKFDITTLKAFESRVLVRTSNHKKWVAAFYSHYDKDSLLLHCVVGGLWYEQCIPYNDETKHLLNTTNNCDEYYKNW